MKGIPRYGRWLFAGILSALVSTSCERPERETDRLTGTETVKGRTNVYTPNDSSPEDDDKLAGENPSGVMHRLDPLEREFVSNLLRESVGGLLISGMAKRRSENVDIRGLAESLLQHHSRNLEYARALAMKPIPDREMEENEWRIFDKLLSLKGSEFDRAYIDAVVERHELKLNQFRRVATASHDEHVRDFIASAIPDIEDDLRRARQLQQSLNG